MRITRIITGVVAAATAIAQCGAPSSDPLPQAPAPVVAPVAVAAPTVVAANAYCDRLEFAVAGFETGATPLYVVVFAIGTDYDASYEYEFTGSISGSVPLPDPHVRYSYSVRADPSGHVNDKSALGTRGLCS